MTKAKSPESPHFPDGVLTAAVGALQAHPQNYNRHGEEQVGDLMASLRRFGQRKPVVTWRESILAGHGLVEAARRLGWPAVWIAPAPETWTEAEALAYLAADNELARAGDPDRDALAILVAGLGDVDAELARLAAGGDAALRALLAETQEPEPAEDPGAQVDKAEELQEKWNVQPGDLWAMNDHRLLCGDCREPASWERLLGGSKANGVFTSPPYAEQRKEQYGGTPADEYVAWWQAVQANVKAHLAPDGSFFVNIKPHCADGERVLYVFDLVLAMKRQWGWKYVDDLVWVKNGFPGGWENRFRDRHEPIYHFANDGKMKFRPDNVATKSDDVFDYAAGNTANETGSNKQILAGVKNFKSGLARPGNVLQIAANREDLGQSAMFPVALPDFFVRAYSDAGDVWLDPFCGSGTTIVAAHNNKRRGMGIEMLPKYCAVILERVSGLGITPTLVF